MNIETNTKENPKPGGCLLFSGGMDSVMSAWQFKDSIDLLLYIQHGSPYEEEEILAISRMLVNDLLPHHQALRTIEIPFLRDHIRDDAIVPLRNMFFIAAASMYRDNVYIGAMEGDRTLDKSPEFLARMENLLCMLFEEQHWCAGRNISVKAPYKDTPTTKTSAVQAFLRDKYPAEALRVSFSCYDPRPNGLACGWCKPCFRKWVALANADIKTSDLFENNPWEAPWLPEVLPMIKDHKWRGAEDVSIMKALRSVDAV